VAWGVLAVLAIWTAVTLRRPPLSWPAAGTDLALAAASVLITLVVDDPARIAAGEQTLPAFWPAAAVLAWAVRGGRRDGLIAALVVSAADLLEVRRLSPTTVNNIVLLLLVGLIVGYGVELFRAGRRDLARAVALEAATRERERLAADIHDSVLQVLGYVQRMAGSLDGEARELARLAGEQEARLRALVAAAPASSADGETDVRAALAGLAGGGVTVTGPGYPVMLDAARGRALIAAARAALDNVTRHAGGEASAWVLLEEEPEMVTVTVRDDGVGMADGRLEAAAAQGRLGVRTAIRGRLAEVGGSVLVTSAPGHGTEVEMNVPRGPR
jgi:signal transduction histidine kinase